MTDGLIHSFLFIKAQAQPPGCACAFLCYGKNRRGMQDRMPRRLKKEKYQIAA